MHRFFFNFSTLKLNRFRYSGIIKHWYSLGAWCRLVSLSTSASSQQRSTVGIARVRCSLALTVVRRYALRALGPAARRPRRRAAQTSAVV